MSLRPLALAVVSLFLLQAAWTPPAVASTGQATSGASAEKVRKVAVKKASGKKVERKTSGKKRVSKRATANKVALKREPAPVLRAADVPLALDADGLPQLRSSAFVVANAQTGNVIIERKGDEVVPIASITKLMTAMVVLDAGLDLSEEITVSSDDIDTLKGTGSRLPLGTRLTREEMLHLALMSSENRAASALARHYPGGEAAFVAAMNVKARLIGLVDTQFSDSTGLNPENVSSPRDLVRMVAAASTFPLIREFSTSPERHVKIGSRVHRFGNTNALVRSAEWDIAVQKTGYIREAGRCLVMQAKLLDQPVVIVLMDSDGRYSRTADAVRVKKWLETAGAQRLAALAPRKG